MASNNQPKLTILTVLLYPFFSVNQAKMIGITKIPIANGIDIFFILKIIHKVINLYKNSTSLY